MANLLKEYSPYTTGKEIQFSDGTTELDMGEFVIPKSNKDKYFTPISSTRLDSLAYEYYSDSVSNSGKYWWLLAISNDVDNPMDQSEFEGREIVIPDILEFKLKN